MIVQQSTRRHDHSGLAKSALRHFFGQPGTLAGMSYVRGKALNSDETAAVRFARWDLAAANTFAVLEDSAGTAHANAAPELCASERERITNDPKERRVIIDINGVARAIHHHGDFAHSGSLDR